MTEPTPSATGSLEQTPLAHLLLYVAERRQTGTLHVRWGSRAREDAAWIYQRDGVIRCARAGTTEHDLLNALSPLCALPRGQYAYYADVDLVHERADVIDGELDPRALLTHALRTDARDDVVDAVLSGIGSHLLQLVTDAQLAPFDFNASELAFVRRLSGQAQPLDALLRSPHVSTTAARRLIYLLRATRAVALLPAGRQVHSATLSIPAAPAATGLPSGRPATATQATPAAAVHPSGIASAAADLPEALRTRWQVIARRAVAIQQQNYFQMLGLDTRATTPEVQNAYAHAAREWHPDRLPPQLGALREQAREIFDLLTEARDALLTPAGRLEHLTDVNSGGGTPATRHTVENALKADTLYQKAQVLLRRKQPTEALAMVRDALALDPSHASYLALAAWLLHSSAGAGAVDEADVDRMLTKALHLDPRCERAHHYRAMILKQAGRDTQALHHFGRALELNPKNLEAERELRLAHMRAERAESQPLLKRLFRSQPPGKKTGTP